MSMRKRQDLGRQKRESLRRTKRLASSNVRLKQTKNRHRLKEVRSANKINRESSALKRNMSEIEEVSILKCRDYDHNCVWPSFFF